LSVNYKNWAQKKTQAFMPGFQAVLANIEQLLLGKTEFKS
jgi:hypothetical protein